MSWMELDPDLGVRSTSRQTVLNTAPITYTCIPDRRVIPRARASLPRVLELTSGGVRTRRRLPPNTRFGPVQGVRQEVSAGEALRLSQSASSEKQVLFLLKGTDRRATVHIDVSDENVSNWLRYVPPAAPGAATLRLKQMGRELYAVSPRALAPRAPLTLAWEPNRLSVSTEKTPGEEEGAVEDDWCCYECGEQLDSAASLELHLETHEPPPALVRRRKGARGKCRRLKSVPKCPKCHQVFSRTFCLNRHMLSCAKQTPISKQILELNQPTEVNSVAPKKREVSPRINGSNVPCDSLDEPSSAINAQQNKATENGATHYVECALCDERHSNLCKYREHTETHRQPDGTFHCTYCAKRYPLYTRVRKHVRTYHAPRRRLPCPHGCPLSFPYQALLTTHLLTHSLVKQFECECGKAFKRKSKLLQHVREKHPTDGPTDTHGGERIGACLMKNVKKHAFVCQLCQLSFRRRSMLVEHINSRHPDCSPSSALELARGPLWDYRCTRCPRVYRSAAQRKKHFLHLHSGEDPPADDECVRERDLLAVPTHRCPVPGCVKQYASNGKLLRHIRQKHIQNTQVRGESADASTNQEVETEAPPPPPPPSLHLPTPLLPPVEFDDCAAVPAILFLAADEHTAFMYQQGQAMQAVTLELEEAGMGGDETLPGAAVGYLTVRPPPGSEVEFMDTPTLSHSEGGYLTAPPPPDSEGGYLTVPPPPDPEGGYLTAPPPPDSEGGYLTAPPPPDSEGGYLTAPPPPDSEGGYLMAPPPPDSEERYLAAPPPPYYYQHNYMDNSDVPDM